MSPTWAMTASGNSPPTCARRARTWSPSLNPSVSPAGQAAAPAQEFDRYRITPVPEQRYEPFALTDVQQAYWIGRSDLLVLGNIACHIYAEIEFDDFDLDRFNVAWQTLIERHDMLRTLVLPDGRQQVLEQVPPYQIEVLDLRAPSPKPPRGA